MFIIVDVILAAILFLIAMIGRSRGFIRTLAGLAATAAAALLSMTIAHFLAEWIYSGWIEPGVRDSITEAMGSAGSSGAEGLIRQLPAWMQGMLGVSGQEETIAAAIRQGSDQVGSMIVAAIRPMLVNLVMLLLAVVLFLVLSLVLRLLLRLLDRVVRATPVVRRVNRVLGFLLGILEGIVIVWLLCLLVSALLPLLENSESLQWLKDAVSHSFLYQAFCTVNPLAFWMVS